MKLFYRLFIFLFLILGGCYSGSTLHYMDTGEVKAPNLVANPSFEHGNQLISSAPANWYVITSSKELITPMELDSTVTLAGKYSLKIPKCDQNMYLVSDAFRINPKGVFFVRCFLKSATAMKKPVKIHFWTYDSAGNKKNSFQKSLKLKPEWNQVSITAGFLKKNTAFGRIAIFIPKDTGNQIWLDDTGCYMVHELEK